MVISTSKGPAAHNTSCFELYFHSTYKNRWFLFPISHVYYGEYPLSFAASLGQEECVRLLLAKGANPNLQDTNGNTVMHMLVIHDKKVGT